MTRPHIAVLTLMGNGHIYPILPLCSELTIRGYRVTYPTNGMFARKIVETGAEPVVYDGTQMSEEEAAELSSKLRFPCGHETWFDISALSRAKTFECVEETVSEIQKRYQEDIPDLVIYDRSCIAGRILASLWGSRVVQVFPHFASYRRFYFRNKDTFITPEPLLRYALTLDSFLAAHGIKTKDNLFHTENVNIVLLPKEFQYRSEAFDERFHFVGALLAPLARRKRVGNGNKLVFISGLSALREWTVRTESFFSLCVEALASNKCKCILSVGAEFSEGSLGPLPENFEINRHTSHLEILRYADLSISHGGMLTTLEALYSGVPVLAIPPHPGCEEVTYRTVELGLGRRIDKDEATVDAIRGSVEQILVDEALSYRVSEAAKTFNSYAGVTMAANAVEQVANEAAT